MSSFSSSKEAGDSIINFGEQLPEKDMDLAMEHAKKADLSIVLGSSLKGERCKGTCPIESNSSL